MSFTVVVQEPALRALARIRAEDKDAFASIRRALAALAEQPHPDEAVAWGGTGIYRHARGLITPPVSVTTPISQSGPLTDASDQGAASGGPPGHGSHPHDPREQQQGFVRAQADRADPRKRV